MFPSLFITPTTFFQKEKKKIEEKGKAKWIEKGICFYGN